MFISPTTLHLVYFNQCQYFQFNINTFFDLLHITFAGYPPVPDLVQDSASSIQSFEVVCESSVKIGLNKALARY